MNTLVIEIVHAPYGKENAHTGLSIAQAWVSAGHKVIVAFHNDGVYGAKKGQMDSGEGIGRPSVEEMIKAIILAGGRVLADQLCMEVRGLSADMLIEGVEVSDGDDTVKLVRREGEGVLTF
jgi:predicted peroxiredoxin